MKTLSATRVKIILFQIIITWQSSYNLRFLLAGSVLPVDSSLVTLGLQVERKRSCPPALMRRSGQLISLHNTEQERTIKMPATTFSNRVKISVLHTFWTLITKAGMRRMGNLIQRWYPAAYSTSVFYNTMEDADGSTANCVALTIDDGLFRPIVDENESSSAPMIDQVCDLLRSLHAQATFFVCSDYITEDQVQKVLACGHELGNHMKEDLSGYYCHLNENDFERELEATNAKLESILQSCNSHQKKIRWFRAPQGRMSVAMKKVLTSKGLIKVMGDCYCDDWAFSEMINSTRGLVAPLMLRQVQEGSIVIFHMPQLGFRETTLDAMREFLQGIRQRNLRAVTVSDLLRGRIDNKKHL